ncbi:MAG TPA: hypothetical protein VNJ08_01630 [Bacteriovoracaceae bacterium]|nr:hypothetical protein [Bacteriovoracaceae bacterium]
MKGENKISHPKFNSRGRIKNNPQMGRNKNEVTSDDKLRQERTYSENQREEKEKKED